MPGFCYFIPGPMQRGSQDVRALGIPGLDEPGISVRGASGPGGDGVLAWVGDAQQHMWRYDPAAQVWCDVQPEASGLKFPYWIGHEAKAKLGPEDLKRARLAAGVDLELGGAVWHVPQVRGLPRKWVRGSGGQIESAVASPYQQLFQTAEQYFKVRFGLDETGWTTNEWMLRAAVQALQVNYRLGLQEALLMELLDTQACMQVLDAVCDAEAVFEALKKKAATSGSNEASGSTPG